MSKIAKFFYVYVPIIVSVVGAAFVESSGFNFDYDFDVQEFLWIAIAWSLVLICTGFFLRRLRFIKALHFFK
jgi:hypothetical protein